MIWQGRSFQITIVTAAKEVNQVDRTKRQSRFREYIEGIDSGSSIERFLFTI